MTEETAEFDSRLNQRFAFIKRGGYFGKGLHTGVGPGWHELIWKLCEDLEALDLPETFAVVQIKEKFGGLRFYENQVTSESKKLIGDAEDKSMEICELCGKPGQLREQRPDGTRLSWIKTTCDEHWQEL